MGIYRQKKYICGNYLEVEIFPRQKAEKSFQRAKKFRESLPAQKKLNDKNSVKTLTRLTHTNFTDNDLCIDLTWDDQHLPKNREAAVRDVKNYIKRLRARREKAGLPELKYIYVVSSWGEDGQEVRIHVHMIINKMDRDLAEKTWGKGRVNSQRLQFQEYGVEDKVVYIAGQAVGHHCRTWACSQNLKRPQVIISDKAVTEGETEKMASAPEDRQFFEKKYQGWVFTDCQVEENFIIGRMIQIRMRRYDNAKHKTNDNKKLADNRR